MTTISGNNITTTGNMSITWPNQFTFDSGALIQAANLVPAERVAELNDKIAELEAEIDHLRNDNLRSYEAASHER